MEEKNSYAVPIAIVIAGALIAGALYFVQNGAGNTATGGIEMPSATDIEQPEKVQVSGIQEDDYVLGNRDAKLVIVEYSDFECPFCARFHATMHQVIDAFGDDIAWVYRQFPLTSLHQQAVAESVASECAGELGGEEAFWAFTDMIYDITPSNDGLDLTKLPDYAAEVGLDRDAFTACLDDEAMLERVQADFEEAAASGGQGTPYSLILYKGEQLEIPGALPFDDYSAGGQMQPGMKSIIEGVLAQ